MLFGQCFYLIFGEPKIRSHPSRFHHRIFYEIVECRFSFVFLDGQNTRHIHTSKDLRRIASLEHTAEPTDILVHGMSARLKLTANGIPFVTDEDERLVGCIGNTDEISHQVVVGLYGNIRVSLMDVVFEFLLDMLNDGVVFKTRGEIGQVEKDDRIFIQVLLKSRVGGYLKISK